MQNIANLHTDGKRGGTQKCFLVRFPVHLAVRGGADFPVRFELQGKVGIIAEPDAVGNVRNTAGGGAQEITGFVDPVVQQVGLRLNAQMLFE